jgi:hypothetical protein
MTALDLALALAARGTPVFPCMTNKAPFTSRGFKDASTDAAQITSWWSRYPSALVGVPTGETSGIFVVDIDSVKHDTAVDWLDRHAPFLPETRQHRTQSGGVHLLFRHHDGLGCSTSKLARGVDTRGEGGYIVWWPDDAGEGELADLPGWIIEQLARPPPTEHQARVPGFLPRAMISAPPIARIRGVFERVAAAHEGERNSLTFWGACVIRDMIVEGALDRAEGGQAFEALATASRLIGLPDHEIVRTIASAATRSR